MNALSCDQEHGTYSDPPLRLYFVLLLLRDSSSQGHSPDLAAEDSPSVV